jgi:hypothetical protein
MNHQPPCSDQLHSAHPPPQLPIWDTALDQLTAVLVELIRLSDTGITAVELETLRTRRSQLSTVIDSLTRFTPAPSDQPIDKEILMKDIKQAITALTSFLAELDRLTSGQSLVTTDDCDELWSLHDQLGEIIHDLVNVSRQSGP